jgi:hypothetical protein
VLEVTFSAFTTERVFRLGQNDRADDLMASNLRSQEHFPFHELIRVGEFYELTASTYICPFILHLFALSLVSHARFFMPLFPPSARMLPTGQPNQPLPTADLDACGHCRSHTQCTVNLDEVVREIIERDRNRVILQLRENPLLTVRVSGFSK